MESSFPRGETHPVTEEGKALHWACERVLMSWLPVNDLAPLALPSFLGQRCPENGVAITEEMVWAGGVYLEDIWAHAFDHLEGLRIEQQVSLQLSSGPVAGRVDCKWHNHGRGKLTLWDLKFGYRPVSVFENWQLLIYALASVTEHTQAIELVIVQPRGPRSGEPISRWHLGLHELREWYRWVANSAQLALGPQPPTHPGAWCHYCKAAGHCEVLEASTYRAMEYSGLAVLTEMDERQIAVDLYVMDQAKKQIAARYMALEALAISRIQAGKSIPGHAYQPTQANRRWTKSADEMINMAKLYGKDIEERKPMTPNQAEGAGFPRAVIDLFTERPNNPAKLKVTSAAAAREAFRRP